MPATPATPTFTDGSDHAIPAGNTSADAMPHIAGKGVASDANNVKLSLTDVLNLGEQGLFMTDGHRQLMMNGANGDTVDLSNTHIAAVAARQWQKGSTTQGGRMLYKVYEHTGAHTEKLVQRGVQKALHNR